MTSKYVLLATIFCGMASPALAQQGQSVTPQQQNAPRQSPFERADINNDGVITRDEVRTARTATFNRLDANKDGFLVQSEMPPPPHGQRGGPGNRQGPLGARPFNMGGVSLGDADANKDGTITRAE